MRFLKNKIARAQKSPQRIEFNERQLQDEQKEPKPLTYLQIKKRQRISGSPLTPITTRETKNIVKNYGRAICKFNNSSLALPYLKNFFEKEGREIYEISLEKYIEFVKRMKESTRGLQHFRLALLENEDDGKEILAYKKIFKYISEIFINYFSINWIFNSKIQHKMAHLKFRFSMLRRIKRPELFTYLVNTRKKVSQT